MGARSLRGQHVPIMGGHQAYLPAPLPPVLDYSQPMVSRIHDAASALGGVASIGDFIPNPRLLVIPFLNIEAVLSSRIEGTVTTLPALFESQVAPEADVSEPTREVRNYLDAMFLGMERLNELPISARLTRELHRVLLRGVRGRDRTPGEFRSGQVHIGPRSGDVGSARYVPPPPHLLGELMSDWERFLNEDTEVPILIRCALMHAQFEMIHPFWDGNGRVGRLLMSIFLIATGKLSQPLLFLSAYLERHRDEYYEALLAISRDGDWSGWLSYFLSAVTAQSHVAVEAARNIIFLREHMREQMGGPRAGHTLALIDVLFESPVVTIPGVAQTLDVTFPTASKAVGELEGAGFLEEITGGQRNRRFLAVPLVEALEVAATLSGEDAVQRRLDL